MCSSLTPFILFASIAFSLGPAHASGQASVTRPQAGGETFDSAVSVPALPYTDSGNTCGHANDVEAPIDACGLATGPDVFYAYTPATDQCVDIRLCNSLYNTMLQLYDASRSLVACNDDWWVVGGCSNPQRSVLSHITLAGGQQYFIAVDGFGGDCGSYQIDITECPPPCPTGCPPGAMVENEPPCGPDTPPEDIQCRSPVDLPCSDIGVTWCGTFGHHVSPIDSSETRDVDNFRFTLPLASTVTVCICSPQDGDIEIYSLAAECGGMSLCWAYNGNIGDEACCSVSLPAGTYGLAVTDRYSAPCGTPYVLRVNGLVCASVGIESSSWTRVKTLYR